AATVEKGTKEPVQARVAEVLLRWCSGDPHVPELGTRIHGVAKQARLPHAGLAAKDAGGADARVHLAQELVDHPTFVLAVEERQVGDAIVVVIPSTQARCHHLSRRPQPDIVKSSGSA